MDSFEFSAELWIWDARGEEGWTFISVPLEALEEIRAFSAVRPRAGFGSVRVSVTIGGSSWRTSVFPSENGSYVLPAKKAVRRAEGRRSMLATSVQYGQPEEKDRQKPPKRFSNRAASQSTRNGY